MRIINDPPLLSYYIHKYNIQDMFEKEMMPYMTLVEFQHGEDILHSGQIMEHFYFVVDGKVKIFKELENGKSVLLRISRPFSELGSLEVLHDVKYCDSNVQAIHGCRTIRIDFGILNKMTLNDVKFYQYIIRSLSRKLATSSNTHSMNVTYPFKSRFASYLISISKPSVNGRIDEITFEHLTDLATFLGTSYRHLNRVIKELEDDQIIQKNKGSFTILDYNRLSDLSGGYYE